MEDLNTRDKNGLNLNKLYSHQNNNQNNFIPNTEVINLNSCMVNFHRFLQKVHILLSWIEYPKDRGIIVIPNFCMT